jgi:hypothetical protein
LSPKVNLGVNLNSRSSSNLLLPTDTDYPDSFLVEMGESINNKIKIDYKLDSTKYIEVSRGDKIVKITQALQKIDNRFLITKIRIGNISNTPTSGNPQNVTTPSLPHQRLSELARGIFEPFAYRA